MIQQSDLIMEVGVYFGLDDEIYHASEGFSSGGVKNLLISPGDYWVNYVDPDRQETNTAANIFGTAMHKRVLEGPDLFYQNYAVEPDISEYPEALRTKDQLKMKCKEHKVTLSGDIPELVAKVLKEEPGCIIWQDILEKFNAANAGKIIIDAKMGAAIESRLKLINRNPDAVSAFTGGEPEVSIFWDDEETGLRMKTRIDRLKIKAIIDLKNFANQKRVPVDRAIALSMANLSGYIQPWFYMRGVEAAKRMLSSSDKPTAHIVDFVLSDPKNEEFIENLLQCDAHEFWFVFIESSKAPNIRVRKFEKKSQQGGINAYWLQAEMVFWRAVEIYKKFKEENPDPSTPWLEYVPASAFIDEEFPAWMVD